MEMYQKPIMKIVELGGVDVLTCSGCIYSGEHYLTDETDTTPSPEGFRHYDGCLVGCPKH